MRKTWLFLGLNTTLLVGGQPLAYDEGKVRLAGYLARPESPKGLRPGVVVVHQWMGLSDHERRTVDALADLGYVALAADIYGEGIRPTTPKEAGAQAGLYRKDRSLYQKRIQAALEALKAQKGVDPARLAVIGFCFGGTGALEAARAGLPVKAVVSFHGGLLSGSEAPTGPIQARVLVCHGAEDPSVPPAEVARFQEEMKTAKADYVFIAYAGAVHAFTQKEAGNDPSRGAAYQETAARRSWQHMRQFLQETLE